MIRSDVRAQFLWYLIVGGLAFFVDIAAFVALSKSGIPWLGASAAAFVIATVANYILSYRLAFLRGRFSRAGEVSRLFAVALVGLGLNTSFVWLFVATAGLEPVVGKILAVPLVLAWNFLGRRIFVFHKTLPDATFEISAQVFDRFNEPTKPD